MWDQNTGSAAAVARPFLARAAGVIGQEPLARPCVSKVEPSTENPRTVHNEGSRGPRRILMALGRGSRCQRTIGGVARAGSRVRDRADTRSLRCEHGFGSAT